MTSSEQGHCQLWIVFGIPEVADKLPHSLMSCEIPSDTRNEDVSVLSDSQGFHTFR